MLTLAALLLAAPASAAPPPERELLDAFKEVCWAVPDTQRIADNAMKRGWSAVSRGKDARTDRLRTAIESDSKKDYRVTARQFERLVAGRRLLLTIIRGELTGPAANGFGSTNCQVRELGDSRPLSMAFVEEWVGRTADEASEDKAGSFRSWYSTSPRDPMHLMIAFVPSGSPLAVEEMIPGIYLNAEDYGDRSDVPSP